MKKKKYKVGDVLLNPLAYDLWIVSERYNQSLDKDELFIVLVHSDYYEDIEIANSFIKVGNLYDMVDENTKLKQALNDIRELCNKIDTLYVSDLDYDYEDNTNYEPSNFDENILQIIDKALGDDNSD